MLSNGTCGNHKIYISEDQSVSLPGTADPRFSDFQNAVVFQEGQPFYVLIANHADHPVQIEWAIEYDSNHLFLPFAPNPSLISKVTQTYTARDLQLYGFTAHRSGYYSLFLTCLSEICDVSAKLTSQPVAPR